MNLTLHVDGFDVTNNHNRVSWLVPRGQQTFISRCRRQSEDKRAFC